MSLCILAVSAAFMAFYGQVYQPSPLLNTNLKFWTLDLGKNLTRPYLWEVDIIKGSFDNVTTYPFVVDNRPSIALRVDRRNLNNTSVWTTVHVRQDLKGQALDAIFRSKISLWVFPTFAYWYGSEGKNPENTFGIEINDGTHLLWYVFADGQSQVFQLPNHRIVLIHTPLDAWSLRDIDIAEQYQEAGWKIPESISFILILGTTWVHPGDWVGYFSSISVAVGPLQTEKLSSTQRLTLLAADAVAILALAVATAVLQEHKGASKVGASRRQRRFRSAR
jgi:hypothetical protein